MHPFGDLSAYMDNALSSEDRTSVRTHLDTCALCRMRLAELRGTARLIAGLPMPVPSRSLVPRVSVPFWLAPLRTFTTFASGAAIFLFLATAVLSSFPRAVGTSAAPAAGGAPAAAPAPNTALNAPQASPGAAADSATNDPSKFQVSAPSPAPPPNTDTRTAARSGAPRLDEVGRQAESSSSTDLAADGRAQAFGDEPGLSAFLSPWLWLWLGLAFGGLSFVLSRRLRST